MNIPVLRQSRLRKYGLIFAIWTLVVIIEAGQNYASRFVENHTIPLGLAIRRACEQWCPWVLLTVAILWVARRLDLEKSGLKRWVWRHLGTSALVALVYFVTYAWLLTGQKSVIDGTTFEFAPVFKKLLIYHFLVALVIYWVIVLAHQSWRYYQRNRERELQASALVTELARTRLEVLRMQ